METLNDKLRRLKKEQPEKFRHCKIQEPSTLLEQWGGENTQKMLNLIQNSIDNLKKSGEYNSLFDDENYEDNKETLLSENETSNNTQRPQ